jgi:hypothetical protein
MLVRTIAKGPAECFQEKHKRAESNWLKTPILRWGKRDDRENLVGKYPTYKADVTPQGNGKFITALPLRNRLD